MLKFCYIVACGQGSHRAPKVSNVLEFDFFIRVPSNVLEFDWMFLNVLESDFHEFSCT